jgi:hypothetical protein
MRMPPVTQIDIAIEWLRRCNDGVGGEAAACTAVANWLAREKHERFLRWRANKTGVPIGRLRHMFAKEFTP